MIELFILSETSFTRALSNLFRDDTLLFFVIIFNFNLFFDLE